MDKDKVISFSIALDNTNDTKRSILIGNGFSRSISSRFSYENLLELTNNIEKMGQYHLPIDLPYVFKGLDTVDFEKVIAYLEVTQTVLTSYTRNKASDHAFARLAQKIKSDKESAKTIFVHAINYTHQNLASNILSETYSFIGDFLYNFNSIFTLNYDLLLYWMLMRKMNQVGESKFKFDDGFTRYGWGINEACLINQNIYYLHGALHLFYQMNLFKITCDEYDTITNKITEHIMKGKYPLTVMEGKHENKKKKIQKNAYLNNCYKKMKNMEGCLFILGTSLNAHADKHIYNQIKNSNFNSIYFGLYDHDDNDLMEKIKCLGWNNKKEIIFFDSKSAINWKPVEEEDTF